MYNNIQYHYSNHEPIEPSYMNDKIISLKIGRNLFVDNYLIEEMTNCNIKYYKAKLHEKNPERIIEEAVKGMLPKNKLGKSMIKKLKVFKGSQHDHESQKPTEWNPS